MTLIKPLPLPLLLDQTYETVLLTKLTSATSRFASEFLVRSENAVVAEIWKNLEPNLAQGQTKTKGP
jgi:hypothetical protein